MRKIILLVVTTLLIVAAAAILYWWFALRQPYSTAEDIYKQTLSNLPTFSSAVESLTAGRASSAIVQLKSALTSARNADERTMVTFYLASAYEADGDYVSAIDTLQTVPTVSKFAGIHALAVEEMAAIYVNHTNASTTAALFDGEPYASFVATSTDDTVRNLYQYAASLYPLPLSQYAIANIYASTLLATQGDDEHTPDPSFIADTLQRLKTSIELGDAAPSNIATFTYPTYLADAQLLRAVVLGRLQKFGDTSLGSTDETYRKAIEMYQAVGASDGIARLKYAYFLADQGESRAADAHIVLAPLYQVPQSQQTTRSFLSEFVGKPKGVSKTMIIRIAAADPDFKTYLRSLGWADSDFK